MSRALFHVAVAIAIAGCATAGAGDEAEGGVEGDDAGASGDDAARGDAATPGLDAGVDGSGDDASSTPDADIDGGMDAGADGGTTTTIPCTSPNACTNAVSMTSISGDTTGSNATANGTTSQWFTIVVTENDSSAFAVPMKLAVALDSPAQENFDLYVYLGSAVGQIECTAVKAQSTNGPGMTDTVSLEWGETGTFANGVDDTRTVTIEVRSVGTCDSTKPWGLTAHGH
jgi:hypothetical protein